MRKFGEIPIFNTDGFKYRIYPTEEQEIQLAKTFGSCRFVYNQLLAKKREIYK